MKEMKQVYLAEQNTETVKNLTIKQLESVLKEFGFDILSRESRSTMARVFIPTLQWQTLLGYADKIVTLDIRALVLVIVTEWNKESEPTDSNLDSYDSEILPAFGQTGTGTLETMALIQSEPATEPTVTTEKFKLENPTEKETGTTMPTTSAGNISLVVKIVNHKGKSEVTETSNALSIPVGKIFDSNALVAKEINSLWLCDVHLTGKLSIKVDSVKPYTVPVPVSIVTTVQTPTEPTIEPFSEPTETRTEPTENPTEQTIPAESVPALNRVLDADVSTWNPTDYYISPESRLVWEIAYNMLKENPRIPSKILMTGDSGYGKTTIAERFAAFVGFDCLRMNCAGIRDTEEWFFDRELEESNGASITKRVDSEFVIAMERGNCVIILDEFNRLETNLTNSLFPLLDDSAKTVLHHREYKVGQNVIFVATANIGFNYAGTFPLDDAMINRFEFILPVKAMPYDHECAILQNKYALSQSNSEIIVGLANTLRESNFVCSTRNTLAIAKMVRAGMSIRQAFEFNLVKRIADDDTHLPERKAIIDLINTRIGAPENL